MRGAHRLRPSRLAWLPIPILFGAMAVLWVAALPGSYESPHLLLALNFVFSTLVSLFIAYLVGRSFLARSTPGLLLLGCGVMLQSFRGSILGWTGRAAQLLGGLYMLIAAVASVRESHVWGISLEAALREERDFSAAVLDTAGALVVVFDAQRRITRFNRACERLTGYPAPEVLGRAFWESLIPPDEIAGVMDGWEAVNAGNVPIRHENHWLTRAGTQRLIDWSITALTDKTGEVCHTIAIGIDITGQRRAEEALRELNATLEDRVAQRTAELGYRARQLQKLTLGLSQAEERERRRIAVILHEDLQQQIAGAKFHLNLVRNRARDARQRVDVERVDEMLKEAIKKSRSLSHDLSPAVLHMNDLAEVLQWLANRVQAQHGLVVDVRISAI